mgnify:CR=1 FL=1
MKCLRKYQWVKLSRAYLPQGKGVMGHWAKLASRAAFRKGQAVYCGYTNEVVPGMWSGGIVGLKSILGPNVWMAAYMQQKVTDFSAFQGALRKGL